MVRFAIVGISDPYMSTPLNPEIPNSSGFRLWKMTGLSIEEYRDRFILDNLFEPENTFPSTTTKINRLMARLDIFKPLFIIALGQTVANAFGLRDIEPLKWTIVQRWRNTVSIVLVPHTSGLNRWYNDSDNTTKAIKFMITVGQMAELINQPMECPVCGEITLEAQSIETTPDGRDYTTYECSECHHEENS